MSGHNSHCKTFAHVYYYCASAKVSRRLHGAIYLPSMNWTYGDTGFYSGQTSYLNMKVFTFAKKWESAIFLTTANLNYVDTSVTTQSLSQHAALEPCIKVHCSQSRSISYNFVVADYRYSTATISYKSLTLQWSVHLATGLLHYSTSHSFTALLMATALLYNTNQCLWGVLNS